MTSTKMIVGDATDLPLEDESVEVVVTSPPYNVGIDYAGVDDTLDLMDYYDLARGALREMFRVVVPGGRLWLNVPAVCAVPGGGTDARRNPASEWLSMAEVLGWSYRDTVAWVKTGGNASTAWGSYRMPSAPNLRGRWETVLVLFKGSWKRDPRPQLEVKGRTEDLTREEWPTITRNVWEIPPARSKTHPAVFPDELVRRAIILSTWPGETVLDPFAGDGTTLDVARSLGRNAIGIELSEEYVDAYNSRPT